YAREHDAASELPPLSLRRPVRTVRLLLGARAWLTAFVVEGLGWGVYRVAVVVAFAGLVLLALSLVGRHQADRAPDALGVLLWIGGSAAATLLAATFGGGVPAARFGLAAGLLFAGGDICAKVIGYGGMWFAVVVPLLVCYGLGTSTLQLAFQRGDALTAAGIAELTTNAVPIAAGFVLFDEALPPGGRGVLQAAAFAAIVASAALLGRGSRQERGSPAPRTA